MGHCASILNTTCDAWRERDQTIGTSIPFLAPRFLRRAWMRQQAPVLVAATLRHQVLAAR